MKIPRGVIALTAVFVCFVILVSGVMATTIYFSGQESFTQNVSYQFAQVHDFQLPETANGTSGSSTVSYALNTTTTIPGVKLIISISPTNAFAVSGDYSALTLTVFIHGGAQVGTVLNLVDLAGESFSYTITSAGTLSYDYTFSWTTTAGFSGSAQIKIDIQMTS